MDKYIIILKPFFEHPNNYYHIREVAKLTKINHTTIRQYLIKLEKEGYIILNKQTKPYETYVANFSSLKFRNLKLFYNLEKIRISNLLPKLDQFYAYPTIILFGSYAKAQDDEHSDLDICIISSITKEFSTKGFSTIIKRPVSIHLYNPTQWSNTKKKNPELVNNICNGIVLAGQLEVL